MIIITNNVYLQIGLTELLVPKLNNQIDSIIIVDLYDELVIHKANSLNKQLISDDFFYFISSGNKIDKNTSLKELINKIITLSKSRSERNNHNLPSNMEKDILNHLSLGFKIDDIAHKYSIDSKTVYTHKYNGLIKMRIKNMSFFLFKFNAWKYLPNILKN